MGAGAVGCYYGGMLARAGHDVVLIARASHVDAIRGGDLRLEAQSFDERIAVQASTDASAVDRAQLVLFCVKSQDTAKAGETMRPHLDRAAQVLSLQNGVDNAERLAGVLGRPVIGTAVYVAAEMAGPGHVRHHGRGELVIGASQASDGIAQALRDAGIAVEVSDNIAGVLWAKLVVNCAYNALSALAGLPYGRLVKQAGIPEVMRDVIDECLAVAHASGVRLPGDMHAASAQIARTMPAQFSSTAQDLAKGKKSEIEHLNGVVVRKGEALGIPTPVNRVLLALVKAREAQHAPA